MSSNTWWWLGLGTAAAATVAGGLLIYRHRASAAPEAAPSPQPPAPVPPVPPVPEPEPTEDFGLAAPDPLISEICRKWKVGQFAPDWRPELVAIYRGIIADLIAEREPAWGTLAEFVQERFLITRETLARLCPEVPLPEDQAMVEALRQQEGFYWQGLWDRLRNAVNEALVEYGGG